MRDVIIRRWSHEDRDTGRCHGAREDWNDASRSQGMPKTACELPNLRRSKKGLPYSFGGKHGLANSWRFSAIYTPPVGFSFKGHLGFPSPFLPQEVIGTPVNKESREEVMVA